LRVRGAIYHFKNFTFLDGTSSDKFIILLNTPEKNDPCLFVPVTSKQWNKPKTEGCISLHRVFFLPAGTAFFRLDSWVELYPVYEIESIDSNPNATIANQLKTAVIDEIVNCLLSCAGYDISGRHKKLLNPPLTASIQSLADKFKKFRC